jgi:hypothetical protein
MTNEEITRLAELEFKYETLVRYTAMKMFLQPEEISEIIDETYDKLKREEQENYYKKLYGEDTFEH